MDTLDMTVAVPTYGRGPLVVETVRHVLAQRPAAREILVADQTPEHSQETQGQLTAWHDAGIIRWLRLSEPSIPQAMNRALRESSCATVLFLDDDVIPSPGLLAAHKGAYGAGPNVWAVVGQVLQPGESPGPALDTGPRSGLTADLHWPFRSDQRDWVRSVIACNLSVSRDRAVDIGGFDENFVGVAFRFETEFCRRVWSRGGRVLFVPEASLRHLRTPSGGTRAYGQHLTSPSPMHGVGDYYFALRCGSGRERLVYMLRRPFREVRTRFHLVHPWWIPVKLVGELRALVLAFRLHRQGPRYIDRQARPAGGSV